MAFTKLPANVGRIARTRHTELVALLGSLRGGQPTTVGIVGNDLVFSSYPRKGIWTWGEAASRADRRGADVGIRPDGLRVEADHRGFETWRDGKVITSIPCTWAQLSGEIVHDRLCTVDGKRGVVVVIDLETGKRLRTFGQLAVDQSCAIAAVPDGRVAVSDGGSIAVHDLETGGERVRIEAPANLKLRGIAVSPDGRFAVAETHSKARAGRYASGFAMFDLKAKTVRKIGGSWPERWPSIGHPAAFVDHGRVVALTTAREIRLYALAPWKLLETIDLRLAKDQVGGVVPWDATGAMVVTGGNGTAYVFAVSVRAGTGAKPASEPIAHATDHRDLFFIDARSNKLWRGRVEGTTFTVQWGKRGGALRETSRPFATAARARAAFDKAVADKLRSGYRDLVSR